jgi:hypothetical protein
MKSSLVLLCAAAAFAPLPAFSHHSASRFDLTIRDNEVSGIVKEFEVANPHTKIVLEVTDEKGTRDIDYEGHSRNNYYRGGWRVGLVEVGDEITLVAAPTRDGSDGGYALAVITKDGTRF